MDGHRARGKRVSFRAKANQRLKFYFLLYTFDELPLFRQEIVDLDLLRFALGVFHFSVRGQDGGMDGEGRGSKRAAGETNTVVNGERLCRAILFQIYQRQKRSMGHA